MLRNDPPLVNPISSAWNTVARFDDYQSAQRAVDRLSDDGFPHAWLAVVAAAAGFGLLWGAVFGFVAHSATRGQRDFSSVRTLSASHYDLIARDGTVDQARRMLAGAGLLPDPPVPVPG
jgi:hypothetical protein